MTRSFFGEKYHHLSAIVNERVKDILISDEAMETEHGDCSAFFVAGAKDITHNGVVWIDTDTPLHVLPDTFE